MGSRFEQDTSVTRTAPGRYAASLTDAWNTLVVPHGGFMSAVAVRAMEAELDDPEQRLRSMHTVFAAQVPAGPVEVGVEVLRRGRSMSQLQACVRAAGANAGHVTVAAFGASRPGFDFTDIAPPEVPPPLECPSFRDPPPPGVDDAPPRGFFANVEGRAALGRPPWDCPPGDSSERAYWYRYDDSPRRADGTLCHTAIVALTDTMVGSVFERAGDPGVPVFVPSVDLTVHVFADARSEWILAHNFARHASDGYASLEARIWDPAVGLIAYATQMTFFTFPESV